MSKFLTNWKHRKNVVPCTNRDFYVDTLVQNDFAIVMLRVKFSGVLNSAIHFIFFAFLSFTHSLTTFFRSLLFRSYFFVCLLLLLLFESVCVRPIWQIGHCVVIYELLAAISSFKQLPHKNIITRYPIHSVNLTVWATITATTSIYTKTKQ